MKAKTLTAITEALNAINNLDEAIADDYRYEEQISAELSRQASEWMQSILTLIK